MIIYKRHRFPLEIIQYTVCLYYRFNLSHRDIEDLMAERGVEVSYASIRLWCNKFGPQYAKRLLKNHHDEPRKIVTDTLRSYGVAQRFLSVHAMVYILFNLGRHLVSAKNDAPLRPEKTATAG